jgi:uncharacterized membrane protein (DUF485 family)
MAAPAVKQPTPEQTAAVAENLGDMLRHGEHVDTIESVNRVFLKQRRLSFSFGAVFFGVTLLIPAFTVWWPWWWEVKIWGGFTANYLFVSLLYFVFLWVMAWTYAARADKLDEELASADAEAQAAREIEQFKTAVEEGEI